MPPSLTEFVKLFHVFICFFHWVHSTGMGHGHILIGGGGGHWSWNTPVHQAAELESSHLTSGCRTLVTPMISEEQWRGFLTIFTPHLFLASKHGLCTGSWTCPVPHEPQQPNRVASSRGSLASEALRVPGWQRGPEQNLSGGRRPTFRFPSLCWLLFSSCCLFSTSPVLVTLKLNPPSISAGLRRKSEWQTTYIRS